MADDPYTIQSPSAAKQFGIAAFFGALAAVLTYKIVDVVAAPDTAVGSVQTQGAYKFVFYMTAFAGGLAFIIALKLYKWWADKQYAASLGPPQAIARDRKDEKSSANVEQISATERALAQEDHLAQDDVSTDRKRELE